MELYGAWIKQRNIVRERERMMRVFALPLALLLSWTAESPGLGVYSAVLRHLRESEPAPAILLLERIEIPQGCRDQGSRCERRPERHPNAILDALQSASLIDGRCTFGPEGLECAAPRPDGALLVGLSQADVEADRELIIPEGACRGVEVFDEHCAPGVVRYDATVEVIAYGDATRRFRYYLRQTSPGCYLPVLRILTGTT